MRERIAPLTPPAFVPTVPKIVNVGGVCPDAGVGFATEDAG
jgi:hypothetical protein